MAVGGPPVIVRVRFFNRSSKPVSNLAVNVKGKAPDPNSANYQAGMSGQDVPAGNTKDFLAKPPAANPLTSRLTRFLEVSYKWGSGAVVADRHVFFDIDSPTGHTALDRVRELHITLEESAGNIQVTYTCHCSPDSTLPTIACDAYVEVYPAS